MQGIQKINDYTLECSKFQWTKDDSFVAACLDVKEVGDKHVIDLRVVSKKALKHYLDSVFPHVMTSHSSASYRAALFLQIKGMYQYVYNRFMANYYPKVGYVQSVGRDMYKHQKQTLSDSIHRQYNLWALDMGTGKTLTAATMSKITDAKRTIIICPSLVKWNWLEDMTKEWGFNPMYWSIIDAVKSKSIKAFREKFVVLNFEQVAKNMDYLLSDVVDHIVIDECHYLKNHKSNRSRAVKHLIDNSNNPRVTMLTGTPITNRINDIFNYLKMSGHPLGQNFEAFKRNYLVTAKVRGEKVIGAQNIPDLKGKISNLMIRIRSEDCMDLPDIVIKNYYFDAKDISAEYEQELKNLKDKKKKYDTLHGKEKAQMTHEIKGNIHTLNRIVTTAKVPKIKKLIDHLVDMGEKVVVFAGYKAPLALLEEQLGKSCVKIDGSVQSHKRQQLINKFKEKDYCNVFLGNMQAAGIGINLVNARHVIFMNFPFTPDQIEQAQKRLHRGGQKQKVNVYYTIAKETIDEQIYSMIVDKAQDINALVDGDHKGVINYSNLTKQLFNSLLQEKQTA